MKCQQPLVQLKIKFLKIYTRIQRKFVNKRKIWMGFLRLALALSVFFAHTASQQITSFIDALYAVQIFFMVSGFLIAYVLMTNNRYQEHIRNFYINRILKIYPIYYLILLLTVFIFSINASG